MTAEVPHKEDCSGWVLVSDTEAVITFLGMKVQPHFSPSSFGLGATRGSQQRGKETSLE